jgi:tetratricopeptide (TPR) repeat protein
MQPPVRLQVLHAQLEARQRFGRMGGAERDRVEKLIQDAIALLHRHPAKARGMLLVAERHAARLNHLAALSRCLTQLAWLDVTAGQLASGLQRATNAKVYARVLDSWPLQAAAEYVVAMINSQIGDYAEADRWFHHLIDSAAKHDDAIRGADYRLSLAEVRRTQGRPREAITLLWEAYVAYASKQDTNTTFALNNLALAYSAIGEHDRALALTEQTIHEAGDTVPVLRANFVHTKAEMHLKRGELAETRACLAECEAAISTRMMPALFKVYVLTCTGDLKMAEGDLKSAIASLTHALKLATHLNAYSDQRAVHERLVTAYTLAGNPAAAGKIERRIRRLSDLQEAKLTRQRVAIDKIRADVNLLLGATAIPAASGI